MVWKQYADHSFKYNLKLFHEGKMEEEIADMLKYTQDNDVLIRFWQLWICLAEKRRTSLSLVQMECWDMM